jgi:tetratricopeptide (TPR) repeat protein
MDGIALLEKARLYNQAKQPRAALNILKHLYKLDASNLDMILEVVTAFENLGEWQKARAMLNKGIRLMPQNCDLWIRLSSIYQLDKDRETALKAINKGLVYNPDYLPLLIQKSHLLADLGRVNKMRSLIDDFITSHPDDKKDLLIERASIYQLLSLRPDDDEEEQVKDSSGKVYAVGPLKKAINDLNDAMDCDEEDFRIPLKLARLYKQLNNFELALFAYEDALDALDGGAEKFRISIQQERDECQNASRSNDEQIVNSPHEKLLNTESEGEFSETNIKSLNSQDAKTNQFTAAKDRKSVQKSDKGKPYQQEAISIAKDILKNVLEPNANYIPVNLDKSAGKFFDQVEHEIKKVSFKRLGDFEAKGFNQYLGKQVLLRLFVSGDRQICAVAFEIKPLKPSFVSWLLSAISGKSNTDRFVELQSETVDGIFRITTNSAEVKSFDADHPVKLLKLGVKSSVYDIVLAHKIRLQKSSQGSYRLIPDLNELFSFQERIRQAKNSYRESIGFVTDDELKQLLGKQFEKLASDIRSYLDEIATQTCDVNSGALLLEAVSEHSG